MKCDKCREKTEQTVSMLTVLSDTSSLTTGKWNVKCSPRGSIRPRTDAAARWVDAHAARVRSQAALGKAQSPESREQS